jgi:pSer/pThr/pTyr-binding forkhead associated (FHA) protein
VPTPSVPLEAVLLRVTEGPASGKVLRVAGQELLIGRQAPGDGKLGNDIEISRRHARVTRSDEGTFVIEDLGSTNGTFVNGTRITGAYVLSPGDELEMGDTKLTVEAPPPIEDKVIAPTGAPPAVTTFAAIPAEFSAEPVPAEPEPSEPVEEEPTAQQEAAAPEADAALEAVDRADAALADAAEAAAPEVEAAAPPVEAAPEPEAAAPPVEAAPEPEAAPEAAPEPEAAAPEAEPETVPLPESAPTPEPEPEPAVPLLVASSGPISVRVEGTPSGDLTLHIDDGEAPARFVRRGGAWTVDE